MSVSIDDLAAALVQELQAYSGEVAEDLKTSVKRTTKACVNALKESSPEDTGAYAKSWRARTAYESGNDIRCQVYNKDHYQLTHLLEDGHAKVSGGRVKGQPHIQPAADAASELLEKEVKIRVGR